MLRYSGASCDVTTGSSDSLISSILIAGIAEPPLDLGDPLILGRCPGSTRQSRPASATDGMTLIFGGSPTPERNQVSEIVDCWIALVNLFFANVPTFACIMSSTDGSRRRVGRSAAGFGEAGAAPSSRASAFTSRSFGLVSVGWLPWPATPSARSFSQTIFFSATEMP